MKSFIKKIFLVTLPTLIMCSVAIAQPPPPDEHGEDDDFHPAPVGSGIAIILTLSTGYGAKKIFDARKKLKE